MNIVYIRSYVKHMAIVTENINSDKRVYDAFLNLKVQASELDELFNGLPRTQKEFENKKGDIFRAAVYLESTLVGYVPEVAARYRIRASIIEYIDLLKTRVIKDKTNVDYLCHLNFMYSLLNKAHNLEFSLTEEEDKYFKYIKSALAGTECDLIDAD